MITDEQLAAYERDGAVIIDGPFVNDPAALAVLEAGFDRLHEAAQSSKAIPAYDEPAYVSCVSNPFFEAVAKRVLRAEEVGLFWGAGSQHARLPSEPPYSPWREQWGGGHVDIQATLDDFEATPRRMRCELWHWINDVPAHRGAMRVLLGSHRSSMRQWSAALAPEHKCMLPRVHGLRPSPAPNAPAFPEHVPPPDDGGPPWEEREPTPMVCKAGQILVLCSTTLHQAWSNEDSVTRKALGGGGWVAKGVPCGLPPDQLSQMAEFMPELKARLDHNMQHIVLPEEQFFASGYEHKWPETFGADAKM